MITIINFQFFPPKNCWALYLTKKIFLFLLDWHKHHLFHSPPPHRWKCGSFSMLLIGSPVKFRIACLTSCSAEEQQGEGQPPGNLDVISMTSSTGTCHAHWTASACILTKQRNGRLALIWTVRFLSSAKLTVYIVMHRIIYAQQKCSRVIKPGEI